MNPQRLGWKPAILMYHRVVEAADFEPSVYYFSTLRARFEQQMRALQAWRYHVAPLEHVIEWLEGKRRLPRRTVAITFDDGYEDTFRLAAPVLERYGFPATLFLVADRVGRHNNWDPVPGSDGYPLMGWEQALELSHRGFTLGSHSRTHRSLPLLNDQELRREVHGSRLQLEQRLGMPVRLFAYPYNHADERCQAVVRAAGYRGACAGDALSYHPWCLDRVDVCHASLPLFAAKISPWFYSLRRLRERLPCPLRRCHDSALAVLS